MPKSRIDRYLHKSQRVSCAAKIDGQLKAAVGEENMFDEFDITSELPGEATLAVPNSNEPKQAVHTDDSNGALTEAVASTIDVDQSTDDAAISAVETVSAPTAPVFSPAESQSGTALHVKTDAECELEQINECNAKLVELETTIARCKQQQREVKSILRRCFSRLQKALGVPRSVGTTGVVSGDDQLVKHVKFLLWGKIAEMQNAPGSHRLAVKWADEVMPWFRAYYEKTYAAPLTDLRFINIVSTEAERYKTWPECDRVRTYAFKTELVQFLDRTSIGEREIRSAIGIVSPEQLQVLLGTREGGSDADDASVAQLDIETTNHDGPVLSEEQQERAEPTDLVPMVVFREVDFNANVHGVEIADQESSISSDLL
jgi:hypothetical protein